MRALFRYLLALAALLAIWQIGRWRSANFCCRVSGRAGLFRGSAHHRRILATCRGQRLAGALRHEPRMAGGFPARAHSGPCPFRGQYVVPDGLFDLSSAQDRAAPPVPDLVRARGSAPRPAHCPDHGYQILVVTRASAQGLDKKYLDSFRSLGGTPLQMLRHVLIPAALPDAMTALKVASGTAVAVLFMAESFATRRGLGFLIMDAWGRGDQLEMFTGILAMSLLGVALYELCNVLETRSCRWRNFHMAGKR